MHELRWLYSRDLLGKGGIPIETFDNMTPKRINRIIKLQEQRMEERNKALEEQRKEQDRKMNSNRRK